MPILTLFALLAAGMAVGKWNIIKNDAFYNYDLSTALFGLLFFMGFRLGRSQEIAEKLPEIGKLSLLFALATISGTALILYIYSVYRGFQPFADHRKMEETEKKETWWVHLKDPVILLSFVLGGIIAGWLLPFFPGWNGSNISGWLLNLLLFIIGAQMMRDGINLKELATDPAMLVIPVCVIAGSLMGGTAMAYWQHLPLGRALAVSAGFGWYSLSGVLISDMGDPFMGSIGFLANILRESLSLIIIPLLSHSRFGHIGIGAAGATSMDVTLPLISRSCGSKAVPYALFSGSILSLLVPVMVPLLYHIGL